MFGKKAQVTVELLLVLPIFFLLVFLIMEIGLIGHKIIVVNHAAYEIARIASLTSSPPGVPSSPSINVDCSRLEGIKCAIFGYSECAKVQMVCPITVPTTWDRQARLQNYDVVITLKYPVKLIFPFSNYLLADHPKSNHVKWITVSVRMPIEQPIFRSASS